jgi:hypothetical protein
MSNHATQSFGFYKGRVEALEMCVFCRRFGRRRLMNAAPRFKKEDKRRQGANIIFIKPFWLVNTQRTRKKGVTVWLSIYTQIRTLPAPLF